MTVRFQLADGTLVTAAEEYGPTAATLIDKLVEDTLTGSGAPLVGAVVRAEDGTEHRYADIVRFEET